MSDTGTILSVKGLHVAFDGQPVVKDVSFDLRPGLCIGLVGASGSGKSVTSLALMGLLPGNASVEGSIRLTGDDGPVELSDLDPEQLRRHRGRDLAMVFQEPMTALDPVYRVGDQVAEAMREHLGIGRREARKRVVELFHEVRLPDPEALY
ncbi:MAG TPA: ATP-binding cassette domain-containing protein, partial [Flavobacteriales bacterium]|nr:ATP-binding cassette domain-containing protein [Flavobacteriales bacterium]